MNEDKKNLKNTSRQLDKVLSVVHILLIEHCKRQHTGDIRLVVNMNAGVVTDAKTIFEVERKLI